MKIRDSRILEAQKSSRIKIVPGVPNRAEGLDGDLALSDYKGEVKLYVKYKGGWHGISMGKAFDRIKNEIKSTKDSNVRRDKIQIATNKIKSDGNFTLDSSGDINLDADDGEIYLKDGGTTFGNMSTSGAYSSITLYEDGGASTDDYLQIYTGAHGATNIRTVDAAGAAGHLKLDPDGDLLVSDADVKIDATKILYLDGGTDTYIYEAAADIVRVVVGGDQL